MSAVLLPLAHHPIVNALPFVLPMLLVVGGLLFLVARDRLAQRRGDTHPEDSASSSA